jgi:hypothetical protein
MRLITENLHAYTPALFMDQFGNYVVQCCLRFGAPWTDFIFESMMEKLWETAQGRFGARAMRACLESHSATKEQQVCVRLGRSNISVLWPLSLLSTVFDWLLMPMVHSY